ncbi:unnamed protein product [Cyprideis torosa]|uniref:Beta-catenin-like protein 1 n=1 Tax=Cyprideis torosa TaxID=163714 RepID=A0A7R8ZS95_9CRUS|nr:unnamed protein product [Cyprideis torosa]CAG0895016.1 unnamed protein product [Cyprideis torosa]
MQELIKRLKDTIPELKGQNASTVSVHSGCELLIQFITRAELECNEFQETRRVMLNRGDIFLANVKSSRGKIAKLSGPFLTQKNVRILTHSRSRVVLAALDFASSQNQGCLSVFVTESQPDRSGKEMVKNLEDLKRDNLSARMILDASVAQALEDIDLVLLGAEGVVENGGIINKIGTLTLATCAKAAKKPVYVLVESFKFIRLFPLNQRDLPDEYKYAPFSSKSEPVAERTPMADYTPPDLISLIISDLGILTPSATMNVGELLAFKPDGEATPRSKRGPDDSMNDSSLPKKKGRLVTSTEASGETPEGDSADDILHLLEKAEELDVPQLDETSVRKLLNTFDKRVTRNQEMRIKFPDQPEKFMESEMDLNDAVQELHALAAAPELYPILCESATVVPQLVALLTHENTDIIIATIDLLQELTDLGEDIEDEEGVHNALSIMENVVELRPSAAETLAQQGVLAWILKRLRSKIRFDANKLYVSEILSIFMQDSTENRKFLGDLDGIDVLLQQLAYYKRHNPSNPEETELMENLFDALCSSLMLESNRALFLKGEGIQLMNLMLRERKMSRIGAIRVLNFALQKKEGVDNCNKFVEVLGLRTLFPLFMKTPAGGNSGAKKVGVSGDQIEEHIVSIVVSLLRNCGDAQRERVLNKFMERDLEKVDRLVELHFKYQEKVSRVEANLDDDESEEAADEAYLKRLEGGLFTLQYIDLLILEVSSLGPSSMKERVLKLLSLRGGSAKDIRSVIREYVGNLGSDSTEGDLESQRIMALLNKF